jgi:hypothetical protein
MDEQQLPPDDISEEELRAAYEEQLKRVRVQDILIQSVVSLLNLGARKAGMGGTEEEKDLEQLHQAIEGVRALLPLVEDALGPDAGQLRDVLSQLQMVYAREAQGGAAPGEGAQADPAAPGDPNAAPGAGPAQSSGRLWVPGQ